MQQALLKKEAELRAAEQRRMDEWVGRRRRELEEEWKHERAGLDSVRHQHQLVMDQLTQSEVEKRTVTLRVEGERQRCAELAAALDIARQQQADGRGRLVGVATELKVSYYIKLNLMLVINTGYIILIIINRTGVKSYPDWSITDSNSRDTLPYK